MPTSKELGDCDSVQVEMASFSVAEFSDTLDWRPMLFQEPIIAQKACSLCGVVYRKAIRLPCTHTLCTKCHLRCVANGSACPVDHEPFCEDDVEHLEVSVKYILKRKVACWNAARGCSFIGPVSSLLDHYKECDFSIMSCCLCRSSVLQSEILEHFQNGCSIRQVKPEPVDNHTTQDLKNVTSDPEMNKAIGNVSEGLMSLETSLNRCSEDVRAEGARCRTQWEAEVSKLSKQLNDLSTACTAGFAKEPRAFQATMVGYKEHMTRELSLLRDKLTVVFDAISQISLNHCRPRTVHWYIENWADLKNQVIREGFKHLYSPKSTVYSYSVCQTVQLARKGNEVHVGSFLSICEGNRDWQLEWPFRKVYRLAVAHPKDQSKVISHEVNASDFADKPSFQRPDKGCNTGMGVLRLSTAKQIEDNGFVQNDTLHVFLEIEP